MVGNDTVDNANTIEKRPGTIGLLKKAVPVLMIIVLLMAIVPAQAQDSPASSGVSTYIVVFNDSPGMTAQSAYMAASDFVDSHGGEIKYQYNIINGMAVDMSDSEAAELSSLPNVKYVEKDGICQAMLFQAVPQIGANDAWAEGYDGTGVRVAVIDSGVDANHPDLNGSKIVAWADFVNGLNSTLPYDDNGHGTHCAGVVASTGNASGGMIKGVAPGASLLVAKVINRTGYGLNSDVIRAMDWAVENNAQVISLSLGATSHYQSLDDAVDNAVNRGITVVVAAGNNGPTGNTPHIITCPGDAENAITVGAVYKFNDTITGYSSRGPTWSGSIKPDVVNVGDSIISDKANGNSTTGYYSIMSGTSTSTPMTAGVVALMLQRNPSLTPQQVKYILERTAKPLKINSTDPIPNNNYGWGRVCANYSVDNATLGVMAFNVSSYYVNESAGYVTINVTKTGNSLFPVNINYATSDGTAAKGTNYADISGTLSFQPADTYQTFNVNIIDDGVISFQKYFTVTLSSPVDATLSPSSSAQVFINDTDVSADFSSNVTSGLSPLTVQFTDMSMGNNITGRQWNFGDGTANSTELNPVHTFIKNDAGSTLYNVALTVINDSGSSTLNKIGYINVTNTTHTFEFDLKKGWNIMSVPFVPLYSNITDVFPASAMDDIEVIWQYNTSKSSPWEYYTPRTDLYEQGSLTTIDEKHGYYVYCDNATSFQVSGTPVNEALTLSSGWNLIGSPSLTPKAPGDLYSNVEVMWEYNSSNSSPWSYYTSRTDIYEQGSLTSMKPGYGYLIYK